MKRLNDDGRAMTARVHCLAVAAMEAAAASVLPGPDIRPCDWERLPEPLQRRLHRTLANITAHDSAAPRAAARRSAPAPRGMSRILPG
jgi:hypothetical protein